MKINSFFITICIALVLISSAVAQQKTYVNKKRGVSFKYPSDFRVKVEEGAEPSDFTITISPVHPQRNSNGDYHFEVTKSALETNSVGNGNAAEKPPKGLAKTRIINGAKFKLFADSDAGAGQYFYNYGYRGTIGKSEWTIEYKEHTSPRENFEPKVRELNTSRGPGILSGLVNSLRVALGQGSLSSSLGLVRPYNEQKACLLTDNSLLRSGQQISVVDFEESPRRQKILSAVIGEKITKGCEDADSKVPLTAYELTIGPPNVDVPLGIGVLSNAQLKRYGNSVRGDVNADGSSESFRICWSDEGAHLTVWSGVPLMSARLWHAYYYAGYDTPSNCSKKDYR
ncbi:MAG: hypothetical protein JO053_14410 [Acidobacteria bacterium]|nr:hypothetical protein [Acidobacteriota bacterium]